VIERDDASPDWLGRSNSCALPQESQAAQFGLELLASIVAKIELREHREGLAVEHTARMRCPVVQVGERIARPTPSEVTGCCVLNGGLDVCFEEWVSGRHELTIMAAARDRDPDREVPVLGRI
jgi:hypothetical protein